MHRLKLYQWFIDNSGKEVPPKEKSLDTPDHKTRRKRWVKEWYNLLIDKFTNVVRFDKKVVFITNRRRKIKKLPLGKNEKEGDDKVKYPQMRWHRFPIKFMFMGVVGQPRPDNFFDGMILLQRVNKTHIMKKKKTPHQCFSDEVIINSEIKAGRWKDEYIPEAYM